MKKFFGTLIKLPSVLWEMFTDPRPLTAQLDDIIRQEEVGKANPT